MPNLIIFVHQCTTVAVIVLYVVLSCVALRVTVAVALKPENQDLVAAMQHAAY